MPTRPSAKGFIDRDKREFAELNRVDVSKVVVEFQIIVLVLTQNGRAPEKFLFPVFFPVTREFSHGSTALSLQEPTHISVMLPNLSRLRSSNLGMSTFRRLAAFGAPNAILHRTSMACEEKRSQRTRKRYLHGEQSVHNRFARLRELGDMQCCAIMCAETLVLGVIGELSPMILLAAG